MPGEPICVVCEADGVVAVNEAWYCAEHVDEAFLFISRVLSMFRRWDPDEVEQELREWIDTPTPTNQQGEDDETTDTYSDRSSPTDGL